MLHMQGDKLEHVGILHHNPQGQVAYFHRTSGGKVNSLAAPGDMFNTNYTTVPLTAKAAWDMFEGANESGNYRYPKQRIRTGMLSNCTLITTINCCTTLFARWGHYKRMTVCLFQF